MKYFLLLHLLQSPATISVPQHILCTENARCGLGLMVCRLHTQMMRKRYLSSPSLLC